MTDFALHVVSATSEIVVANRLASMKPLFRIAKLEPRFEPEPLPRGSLWT